ncbi:methyltransferase [Dyella solisilvae]|uniref:Methyltransferase n=1 Tax=Dyella solisilvae TaxID=1920168 RepID=A0A370K7S5_9GAMM|nr:class I SAM-dependent methyltransferase [Dyella solisilvae]RDI98705.1 methyltransferase [Dyella solisilvae]
MKSRVIPGVAALLLAACSGSSAPSSAQTADQPAGGPVPPTTATDFTATQLDQVLAGSWRSQENRARDVYRHPKATLQFFGIRPDLTVIEITPGGGWYSEILAPLLRDNGHYIAAVAKASGEGEASRNLTGLRAKFAGDPERFGKAQILEFDPKAPAFGAPGSADLVLTFRNVHNWVMADTAPAMFKAFYAALRPGGVLGVVDHRAADNADLESVKESGYLPTPFVVKLATDAGFKLEEKSEINANPKDTKDYPKGVWTLPPTLQLGDQDRAKYLAIGESDRMTLRFVKPAPASPAN